jgi:hypothetical protein
MNCPYFSEIAIAAIVARLDRSNFFLSSMKTKFFLMLLTLTGLCWSLNSAAAATVSPTATEPHTALSQTISKLIGLDRDTHSLVELAIDRAVIAQKVNNDATDMRTAGAPVPIGDVSRPNKKPEIVGKIAAPTDRSIGQAKIKKPNKQKLEPNNNQQPAGSTTRVNQK